MSLVIVVGTVNRIVAASDSRVWITEGGPDSERLFHRDDGVKIWLADRYILGAVGDTDVESRGLDVAGVSV